MAADRARGLGSDGDGGVDGDRWVRDPRGEESSGWSEDGSPGSWHGVGLGETIAS